MPADVPPKGSKKDRSAEAAAADWLFQTDSPEKPAQEPPDDLSQFDPNDVFELAESFGVDPKTLPSPPDAKRAAASGPSAQASAAAPAAQAEQAPSDLVEEVWSRAAEWGPTLTVVGACLTVTFLVFYTFWGMAQYGFAFLLVLAGGLVALVLSYPILITLERPVRITPEHAVKDYYGALSHHLPHFRRMWLLLSTAGRFSTAFGSYTAFRAYWLDRLRRLRDGRAGPLTPLAFEILDFTSEKSGGKTRVEAEFKVRISVRGNSSTGPIDTIPMKVFLVRGPDKMWYLENGMLPRQEVPGRGE
jgi:hypothetical protein